MHDKPKQGGFNFEDDDPAPKKKKPGFGVTVEDASASPPNQREKAEASPRPEKKPRREKPEKTEKKEKQGRKRAAPARKSDEADPGTWEWPTLAVVILLLPMVIWLQQWS